MKNRDLFERVAAPALAQGEDAFPAATDVRPHQILLEEGIDPTHQEARQSEDTLKWLVQEGFFNCASSSPAQAKDGNFYTVQYGARLTTLGLNALNQSIDISGRRGSAGELLIDQLKESASDARSAVISDIIGKIIGSAAKSLVGM